MAPRMPDQSDLRTFVSIGESARERAPLKTKQTSAMNPGKDRIVVLENSEARVVFNQMRSKSGGMGSVSI